MAKFHQLSVSDVRQETPETISVAFAVPDALKSEFEYIHGQYLTLKLTVNGEELRRSYSLCSSPYESELRIAVKKVPGGRVSTFLNDQVKAGDMLDVMPPMGNFYTKLDAGNAKHYVAFAAGSGITPIISILKTVLWKEPQSRFTLFYGNKNEPNIIFRIELEHLQSKYGDRLEIHHILTREDTTDPLYGGRIDGAKARDLLARHIDNQATKEYFLCGPEGMISSVSDELKANGVEKSHIHIELFSAPVEGELSPTSAAVPVAGKVTAQVTVIVDAEEVDFSLSTEGKPILDAALDAGADVPFACKGAVCCTCKALVVEGTVSMEKNFALTDEEVEEGFVLTCQAHPTSERVVVDYDEI